MGARGDSTASSGCRTRLENNLMDLGIQTVRPEQSSPAQPSPSGFPFKDSNLKSRTMPPSRTKAPKAVAVRRDASYCDWPGCGKSLSRRHDLLRHKLVHYKIFPYQCKEQNADGTQCEHRDRQLSNLKAHMGNIHGVNTTVKALNLIYPKHELPPALPPQLPSKAPAVRTMWVAHRTCGAVDVDDASPAFTATSFTAPNLVPALSQSSTLSEKTATRYGWVAALPAALAYAIQSTTYTGWISADPSQSQAAQSSAPLPQATAGVFQEQAQEPFVSAPAPFYGWVGDQQTPQSAVTKPAVLFPSNAFRAAPAFQLNWAAPEQTYTAPVSAEASFAYAPQQQLHCAINTQLPVGPSLTDVDTPPVVGAHADDLLSQWTWTNGHTLVPSCPSTTDTSKLQDASSSCQFSSSSSSSPLLSSSSWPTSTSPTELAYSDLAIINAQEQQYARFSGATAAPPAFARDFQFTQEGLTQPRALAVAALAELVGSSLSAPAVESESKSAARLPLDPEAQAMADFEALFGTGVTPAKIESDYFDFECASSDSDDEALSYWGAWGQC
ncbi:hypothetical protein HYPSUDRAFT_211416 [Hypholoma sublateritium FD-334 SS-4]|uniref:C2H2-type domain-containing protein n=1 Tax=Hypholoma sublateritium (strain FD-334 SS-4) TaxID=945553 RepID=A0A0D2PD51_HYPSF|nr:hypothetical protein HYPSUDRAFT_211416 [Hypholoma sublateritium FD-334 SS-4]